MAVKQTVDVQYSLLPNCVLTIHPSYTDRLNNSKKHEGQSVGGIEVKQQEYVKSTLWETKQ